MLLRLSWANCRVTDTAKESDTQLRVTVHVGPARECMNGNECDNMKDKRGITREQNGNDTVVSATLRCCS